MSADDWSTIITKIIPQNAETLDDILEDFDIRRTSDGTCVLFDENWFGGQRYFKIPQLFVLESVSTGMIPIEPICL